MAYPIEFINNALLQGLCGPSPAAVIFLTCDAFGVLPPISRLTTEQAMYHFMSGYTAKLAGTEAGMGNEPQATFSTGFGQPFLPRLPMVYAKMLAEKINKHRSTCYLVNTGWCGGSYGVGHRIRPRGDTGDDHGDLRAASWLTPRRCRTPSSDCTSPGSPGVSSELLTPRRDVVRWRAMTPRRRELAEPIREEFRALSRRDGRSEIRRAEAASAPPHPNDPPIDVPMDRRS